LLGAQQLLPVLRCCKHALTFLAETFDLKSLLQSTPHRLLLLPSFVGLARLIKSTASFLPVLFCCSLALTPFAGTFDLILKSLLHPPHLLLLLP